MQRFNLKKANKNTQYTFIKTAAAIDKLMMLLTDKEEKRQVKEILSPVFYGSGGSKLEKLLEQNSPTAKQCTTLSGFYSMLKQEINMNLRRAPRLQENGWADGLSSFMEGGDFSSADLWSFSLSLEKAQKLLPFDYGKVYGFLKKSNGSQVTYSSYAIARKTEQLEERAKNPNSESANCGLKTTGVQNWFYLIGQDRESLDCNETILAYYSEDIGCCTGMGAARSYLEGNDRFYLYFEGGNIKEKPIVALVSENGDIDQTVTWHNAKPFDWLDNITELINAERLRITGRSRFGRDARASESKMGSLEEIYQWKADNNDMTDETIVTTLTTNYFDAIKREVAKHKNVIDLALGLDNTGLPVPAENENIKGFFRTRIDRLKSSFQSSEIYKKSTEIEKVIFHNQIMKKSPFNPTEPKAMNLSRLLSNKELNEETDELLFSENVNENKQAVQSLIY